MKVVPVPQLMDNYAYLGHRRGHAPKRGIVDCAEAEPVLAGGRDASSVTLTAILPTHHHYDHVGGNEDLLAGRSRSHRLRRRRAHPRPHRAGARRRPHARSASLGAQVIFIPAHTTGHIAYYFAARAGRLHRRHALRRRLRAACSRATRR